MSRILTIPGPKARPSKAYTRGTVALSANPGAEQTDAAAWTCGRVAIHRGMYSTRDTIGSIMIGGYAYRVKTGTAETVAQWAARAEQACAAITPEDWQTLDAEGTSSAAGYRLLEAFRVHRATPFED
jgi:hypothetical protein